LLLCIRIASSLKEPKWENLQELVPLISPVCHAYKVRVGQQLHVWGEAEGVDEV
jgi:hypothetical protein